MSEAQTYQARPAKRKYTTTNEYSSSSASVKRARHDKSQPHPSRPKTKANPIAPLKKRVRSIQRLLASKASEHIPATIQQTHERELASLQSQIVTEQEAEARRSCIAKYHMVRFFERKKAERRLKRAMKSPSKAQEPAQGREVGTSASSDAVHSDASMLIHEAEVDLAYTGSYPLDVPYVSLFMDDAEQDEKDTAVNRGPMWGLVEDAMRGGKVDLRELREGRWKNRYEGLADVPSSTTAKSGQASHKNKVGNASKATRNQITQPIMDEQPIMDDGGRRMEIEHRGKANGFRPNRPADQEVEQEPPDQPKDARRPSPNSNPNMFREPRRIRRARERGEQITHPKYRSNIPRPEIPDDDVNREGKGMDFFEM